MIQLYKHDLILSYCKNKNVLHLGACDSPYHIERARKKILLHQELQGVCKELIGLDVDKKAIEILRNFGIKNIFYGDIGKSAGYDINLNEFHFDYVLLPDTIEHLENPGFALDNIRNLMNKGTRLILTAPNCFSYGAIRNILVSKRNIHPDHLLHTSYDTLTRLFEKKSLKVECFSYCLFGSFRKSRIINKLLYNLVFKRKRNLMSCLFFVLSKT